MRSLISLLFAVLATGCASKKPPQVGLRPLPQAAVQQPPDIRYTEIVGAYHVGRYIDPHHPSLMHEAHAMYRLEVPARWDLHPANCATPLILPANSPADAAWSPAPVSDAVIAELNRQKDATERVMWEATILAQSYDDLQKVIADMRKVAQDHAFIGARLGNAERRVTEVQDELQRLAAPPPAITNPSSTVLIDDRNSPQP